MSITAWRSLEARMQRLSEEIARPEWMKDAACRGMDPEDFYPHKGEKLKADAAKRVCDSCPVRQRCLDYAVERNERFGIWGGQTERHRRHARRSGEVA